MTALFPEHHLHPSAAFRLAIAYIAVPGTALAWLLWMFILSRLDAGNAGIASLLTPVIGVFAAWLQLGERPGTLEFIGIACIVSALVLNLLPTGETLTRSTAPAK
jgi:drug/metabolite transporter (DMT)-like permease